MLNGEPIDNMWVDLYAQVQFLKSHPFSQITVWKIVFSQRSPTTKRCKPPAGVYLTRFVSLLNSFVLRRPETTLALPPIEFVVRNVELTKRERAASNKAYREYERAHGMARNATSRQDRKRYNAMRLKALVQAQQHACHPHMTEIMALVRATQAKKDETVEVL